MKDVMNVVLRTPLSLTKRCIVDLKRNDNSFFSTRQPPQRAVVPDASSEAFRFILSFVEGNAIEATNDNINAVRWVSIQETVPPNASTEKDVNMTTGAAEFGRRRNGSDPPTALDHSFAGSIQQSFLPFGDCRRVLGEWSSPLRRRQGDFHDRCNGRASTSGLIEGTKCNIFGAFPSLERETDGKSKADTNLKTVPFSC
jgi:hypothetical protein